MARLHLRYGESGSPDEEIDVEMLRSYALDAVRRGLPFYTWGVSALNEVLSLIVSDDESHRRQGDLVLQTRRAQKLVLQLGRTVVPNKHFTVLRREGQRI